jgi:hypothetical protein
VASAAILPMSKRRKARTVLGVPRRLGRLGDPAPMGGRKVFLPFRVRRKPSLASSLGAGDGDSTAVLARHVAERGSLALRQAAHAMPAKPRNIIAHVEGSGAEVTVTGSGMAVTLPSIASLSDPPPLIPVISTK